LVGQKAGETCHLSTDSEDSVVYQSPPTTLDDSSNDSVLDPETLNEQYRNTAIPHPLKDRTERKLTGDYDFVFFEDKRKSIRSKLIRRASKTFEDLAYLTTYKKTSILATTISTGRKKTK